MSWFRNKDYYYYYFRYIIPVSNPDGYEYSINKNRLWRKNRRRFSGPCDGVDINRNFDSYWSFKGASSDICAHDYFGLHAFSEQESIAIRDLLQGTHFTGFVSIHGFGSGVYFPWMATGRKTTDYKMHSHVSKEVKKVGFHTIFVNFVYLLTLLKYCMYIVNITIIFYVYIICILI
ncbi:unnamed protein product [Chilo suppressalis]|uniref:Peptidase M14 domain-containing protein n=1 Tax=Chilo suppressalis TaxID=168631 RepID=A0ABN8EC74_CHISP|nr:unnamed protein product [Chilo suppressalis]